MNGNRVSGFETRFLERLIDLLQSRPEWTLDLWEAPALEQPAPVLCAK
jgi:hypothetical protein